LSYTYVGKEIRHLSGTELLNDGNSPGIEWHLNKYHFRIWMPKIMLPTKNTVWCKFECSQANGNVYCCYDNRNICIEM